MHPLLQLSRLDKPIGIWLLYFPAAWAIALTSAPRNLVYFLALFLLGAVITRAAGCIVNDLTDRRLDASVARTSTRPLACGTVRGFTAYVFLGVLLLIALAIALSLPRTVFLLALIALPMIAAYPWMKRITGWPQVFLGLTFNLSVLFGWVATGTSITLPAITLYAAAICWTIGYDTIYAVQDIEDDTRIGIRSTARTVGPRLKNFVTFCYSAMFLLFGVTGVLLHRGPVFYLALAVAAIHAHNQTQTLPPTPTHAHRIFCSNQWLGLIVLIGILLDRI